MRHLELQKFQLQLGYTWQDQSVLEQAFHHTSWCNEQPDRPEPNERLEFLGDSVLDLLSAEFLMARMKSAREGKLSQARAQLVRESALAECARELNIGWHLLVGRGSQNLRDVDSVLADTLEAVIGASYVDGGMLAARLVAIKAGILKWST